MNGISVLVTQLMDDLLDLLVIFIGQSFADDILKTVSSAHGNSRAMPAVPWLSRTHSRAPAFRLS